MIAVADSPVLSTDVLHLRAHREAAGLGPAQLAWAAGVSRSTVNRPKRGVVGGVDFGVLVALAHALGVKPGALFEPPPR